MDKNVNKERSNDRVLVLKPEEGKKALNSTGLVDTRLFTGENKLHAVLEQETNLWRCQYEMGLIPEPLRQKFTSFSMLRQAVEQYYGKRNIEIEKIID